MSEAAFLRLEAEAKQPEVFLNQLYPPVNEDQASRNRYCNVFPSQSTRVRVGQDARYINADWLRPADLRLNGVAVSYIATQAPLEHTRADFWQMVCESNTQVIVMLTPVQSGKAEVYWPVAGGRDTELPPSDYAWATNVAAGAPVLPALGFDQRVFVELLDEHQIHDSLTVRTLRVAQHRGYDSRGDPMVREHVVRQLHFIGWPDYGVPSAHDFALLMGEYRRLLDLARVSCGLGMPPTVLAHCSAGVGRTGTFIAIDLELQQQQQQQYDSLEQTVRRMRACRYGSVQTFEQYTFCRDFVAHCRARGAWTSVASSHTN